MVTHLLQIFGRGEAVNNRLLHQGVGGAGEAQPVGVRGADGDQDVPRVQVWSQGGGVRSPVYDGPRVSTWISSRGGNTG